MRMCFHVQGPGATAAVHAADLDLYHLAKHGAWVFRVWVHAGGLSESTGCTLRGAAYLCVLANAEGGVEPHTPPAQCTLHGVDM